MAKLKLGAITDDKPVKLTVELPADVHRDLLAYAEVLARETGQAIADPSKLVAPMLARFMANGSCVRKSTSDESNRGRGIALSQKCQEASQSRVVIFSSPVGRIADPTRASTVGQLSIDEAGKAEPFPGLDAYRTTMAGADLKLAYYFKHLGRVWCRLPPANHLQMSEVSIVPNRWVHSLELACAHRSSSTCNTLHGCMMPKSCAS